MKIIYKKRGKGKTLKLIKQSAKTRSIIITPTYRMAEHIRDMAKELEYDIPTPLCYKQLSLCHGNNCNILIDNAEMLLQHIFVFNEIDAISITRKGNKK